jgi:hypothetical protein
MTSSTKSARGVDNGFQGFEEFARVTLVLEPVANLLPIRVVPDQIGGTQLGEMPAHGLNRAARQLGKIAWGYGAAGLEENNQLVDDRIAEEATQARFTISSFVHPRRCTAKPLLLSSTLPRFENSRNVETMAVWARDVCRTNCSRPGYRAPAAADGVDVRSRVSVRGK